METAPMENRLEDRVERKGLGTYGFADQVNYSVGLAAWRSLLVSLILPLSASCCCFPCVLYSFFPPPCFFISYAFPLLPCRLFTDLVFFFVCTTARFSLLFLSAWTLFEFHFFFSFFLVLIVLVPFLDEKILRKTLLRFLDYQRIKKLEK